MLAIQSVAPPPPPAEEMPTWVMPEVAEAVEPPPPVSATAVTETVVIESDATPAKPQKLYRPNVVAARVLAGIGLIIGTFAVVAALVNNDEPGSNDRVAATVTPTLEVATAAPTVAATPAPTVPPTPAPTIQQALPVVPQQTPAPAPPQQQSQCHPSYQGACLDQPGDYDCAGGSGNGPNYTGPVQVVGPDEYDLDRDGDGQGCEQS